MPGFEVRLARLSAFEQLSEANQPAADRRSNRPGRGLELPSQRFESITGGDLAADHVVEQGTPPPCFSPSKFLRSRNYQS